MEKRTTTPGCMGYVRLPRRFTFEENLKMALARTRPPAPYPGVPHLRKFAEEERKKEEAGGLLRLLTSIISVVAPRGIEPLLTP